MTESEDYDTGMMHGRSRRLVVAVAMLAIVVASVALAVAVGWDDRPLYSVAFMAVALVASFIGWLNASRPEVV